MQATHEATTAPLTALVRQEGTRFRSRGRVIAMTAASLVTILLGLLSAGGLGAGASCSEGSVEVACPTDPVGPDGQAVGDWFYFVHRPLGQTGSITVRMTSMTGIITYPPPNHDQIVPGLVPWAKAGIIVKDGITQGSPYAALMVTGGHGVRMQYNYTHGAEWTKVGTAYLAALPETAQVGLFVASPGDLTLRPVALGGRISEVRFTQATAVFDNISVEGASAGEWSHGSVGEMGHTDWARYHRPPGLVESNGTFTVTGTGDMGPSAPRAARPWRTLSSV